MSPKQVPNSSKNYQQYDQKSHPAVPGIEPGTLRIRLRGWIRVQPHWANSVTTIPVSRAFLCIRIRDPCAPGAVGLFKIPKSCFLRKNCMQQVRLLIKNSQFLAKNVRWSQNRFLPGRRGTVLYLCTSVPQPRYTPPWDRGLA